MWNLEDFIANGGFTRGILERKLLEKAGKILRNEFEDYVIDSCYTFDSSFETAIRKTGGDWIIVENYDTENDMKKGHKKWLKFVKQKPKTAFDVHLSREIEF